MATRPDEPYAADGPEPYDNALTRAQARITETLTELSRLTQDPLFDRADRVIADLVNATASPHLDVDTVHKLRDLSAAYERGRDVGQRQGHRTSSTTGGCSSASSAASADAVTSSPPAPVMSR
jgi:hypothetical protein